MKRNGITLVSLCLLSLCYPAAADILELPTPGDASQADTWADMLIDWLNANVVPNYYSVKTYGAVGDGVTDDTAAIQAAIDAAEAAGGGSVYFPVGTYIISTEITIDGPGLKLYGHRAILKPADNSLDTIINIDAMDGASPQLTIDGLRFSGYPVTGSHTGDLIRATDGAFTDTQIQNCWFAMANSNQSAIHGRFFYSSVTDCIFEFGGSGILCDENITTYTGSLVVQNCMFYKMAGPAIDITDPGSGNRHGTVILTGLRIGSQASASGSAIDLEMISNVVMSDITIAWDDIGENPVNCTGILVTDVNRVLANNVQIWDDAGERKSSSDSRFNYGWYIRQDCNDIRIENSQVLNARYGLRISDANAYVTVADTLFEGGYNAGVLIYSDADGQFTMDNCVIRRYRQQGLRMDSGNTMESVIRGCRFEDNGYTSAVPVAAINGSSRIDILDCTFDDNGGTSATAFIDRDATDLFLWNNAFIGSVTTYSTTNGSVNTLNEGLTIKNGSTSAGYLDIYEDSDNGQNKVTLAPPSAMDSDYTAVNGTLILDDGANWRATIVIKAGAVVTVTTAGSSAATATWTPD